MTSIWPTPMMFRRFSMLMWTFLITTVLPLHWVTEAPFSSKPNGASDKYSFYCLLSLDKCTVLLYSDLFYFVMAQRLPIHFVTMYAVISAMADTTKLIR